MKTLKKDLILALFFGLILPGMLLNLLTVPRKYPTVTEFTSVGEGETVVKVNIPILVRNEDGEVEEMDLDAYIVGVVLAEMPASFDSESKKAQAVAARTFALRAKMTGGKHGDGTVCVSSGCCQAYTTVEDYYGRGGKSENVTSAEEAVLATSGQVLTYENELIQATYFSCSGGSTEDAVAVWGSDVPYLRAKESPGEEEAKYHTDEVIFTAEEFNEALGTSLSGDPGKWFGMTTYTSGDGVATMQIGEKTYSGTQLRSKLGLRSTAFSVEVVSGEIRITTKGFGHRVGMSQYGADAMAAGGSGYREILEYYYPGTQLVLAEGEN